MECENNTFASLLKEAKNIFIEFANVLNEINGLHDSNNLNNFSGSASGLSNVPAANFDIGDNSIIPLEDSSQSSSVGAAYDDTFFNGSECSKGNSSVPLEEENKSFQPSKVGAAYNVTYNGNECSKVNSIVTREEENIVFQSNSVSGMFESWPVSCFAATFSRNYIGSSNVHNVDIDNSSQYSLDTSFGAAYNGNGNVNGYSNENVFGVEVPNNYDFQEKHLERVLNEEASSQNLVNYFYYLSEGFQSHDTFDHIMDSPTSGDIDVGDIAPAFGLTDEPAMMDSVNVGVTTKPITTSSENLTNRSMPHKDSGNSKEFDYGSISEVICQTDFIECETVEVERYRGCDNSKMFIPTSDSGPKRYCCKYCNGRTQKLERHLRNKHKNEKNVKEYLAFPPRSAQRRKIILKIQKQGEFRWNGNADLNGGEYAVRRRPHKKSQKKPWDMIPCPGCLGAYSKSYLRRHWKNECAKNPVKGERGVQQAGRAVEGRLHVNASKDLTNLFAKFNENESIQSIRFDWLVICYGNNLCLNHSPHYQQDYIAGKLRAAGKVLQESKSISANITDMSSIFHVKHSNTIIRAIHNMGKFDDATKRFGSPGTSSTTVTLINAIGELLRVEFMRLEDPEKQGEVERFLAVFRNDVQTKINKLVAVTMAENRRYKNDNIPTTADVNKLVKYLDSEREACFAQLVQNYSYAIWLKLSQLTMVSILVYNRRRVGEMQNLLIKDFEKRDIVSAQSTMLLDSMPEEAKRKIKSRIMVRNKLGKRSVPMLLKHSWDECLELLVHHRRNAGIPESNKYLFALPTNMGRIKTANACTIMRSFSLNCGAENPSSLRGTNLRKHLASFCSTKNLSDNDISNLADFMGHAEAVHRAFYRINPLANQVSNMSFLFDSAQGNDSSNGSSNDISDCSGDESEAVTHPKINSTRKRKTVKKNDTSGTSQKRKRNVVSKGITQARKKKLTTTKMGKKRDATSKTTSEKRKRNVKTSKIEKKRKI